MSLDTLETFTNVPVFAFQLSIQTTKSLRSALSSVGLHLRKTLSLAELEEFSRQNSESLILFGIGPQSPDWLMELISLKECVDPRKTLLVPVSEELLSDYDRELCLASGLVTDIWEQVTHGPMIMQKCRMLLELQQRRHLQCKEQQLLQDISHQRERLLDVLPDGVIHFTAEGHITEVNRFALEILGFGHESMIGSHISQLLSGPEAEDPLLDWCEHPLYSGVATQQDLSVDDTVVWRSDGETLPVRCELAVINKVELSEFCLIFQDNSVRKAEETELDQLTRYDPITGLANVSLMRHFLLKAMARVLRNDRRLAVLYVDLDDFHCINESFGVRGGDSLLRSVGRRLKNCIRTGDMVSRVHNDVFMVVLDEVRDAADVEKLAQQILDNLNTPNDLNGVPVVSHASIGIAFYPEGSIGIDDLMDQAKEAMEWVKLNGKNGQHSYGRDLLGQP